ncbi:MAG: SNF2-related protein, partial [Planctomycetota bacterium]
MQQAADSLPRIGMAAVVRNRRGVISAVEAADGCAGRLHLVHIEYIDGDDPHNERLLWEREPQRVLAEPGGLPDIPLTEPMDGPAFDAMVRVARWSAMVPFLGPSDQGEPGRPLIASPFHAAVQIEDFQLVPLIKALRMPRVSLLIADDVGVGKTIEAGLILSELILRRRVRRALILTPASLRAQWHEEMQDKFALLFEIVDRGTAHSLRRRVGLDANPWRSFPRIIASYHYLRQPDILTEFVAAARSPDGTPQLPWDLLIVDEVHNLAPAPFGEDSDLCKMLRHLVPLFEHRIFLTATPHNGHTRSFTGLLELLDPVRFTRADDLKPALHRRIEQVVVRRLKREINERTDPPRFCDRFPPRAVALTLHGREQRLAAAFDGFRRKVACLIGRGPRSQRLAGTFGLEVLGKRLLSCPVAFAESWRRCKAGMHAPDTADDVQVLAAQRSVRDDIADDREAESRCAAASKIIGAWLKSRARLFTDDVAAIDDALAALGLATDDRYAADLDPSHDARLDALVTLIDDTLR